jgi:hypothetical protein
MLNVTTSTIQSFSKIIDFIIQKPWFLEHLLKGTFQRKLTGVLSGINRKLMICHCSDGYSFFNLKGLRSLKSKTVFSALTGTLF